MFRLFTPLFKEFDTVINTFANTVSSRVMVAITPVIQAAVLLWILWCAILIMTGRLHGSIREFLHRYVRSAVIISLALGSGYYQSTVAAVVMGVPDDLAVAVMGQTVDSQEGSAQGVLIDQATQKGIDAAADAWKKAGVFTEDGIVFLTFGILMLLATVALVALGGAIIITAKVVLGILVALGPLFIACLLFEATRQFFARWVGMAATYGLLIVLFSALFTFMLGIYGHYMSNVRLDGSVNAGYAIAGALILSIVSILVLKEVKPLAMGLGGGMTLPTLMHRWWDRYIGGSHYSQREGRGKK